MAIYTLTGETKEINVLGRYASVKNNGEETIYASCASDLSPEAPDVVPIQAGESVIVRDCRKKLYVRGSGQIAVVSANEPVNFFKPAPKGGSGGGGSGDGITQQQLNDTLKFYATNTSVDTKLEGYAEKDEIPTSLPADGGNADTVGGKSAEQLIQSNPNLLLNPDFRVNPKNKTEFDGSVSGYAMARWKISSNCLVTYDENGIQIKNKTAGRAWMYQDLDTDYTDTDLTLSICAKGTGNIEIGYINAQTKAFSMSDDFTVFSYSFHFNGGSAAFENSVGMYFYSELTTVKWIKLEPGFTATPFVAPNQLEEVLRCGPIENESQQVLYGDGKWRNIPSNPNLLDNADFKINQRGLSLYNAAATTFYTVDRWRCQSGFQVAVTEHGVEISPTEAHTSVLTALLQNVEYKKISGAPNSYTLSVSVTKPCSKCYAKIYAMNGITVLASSPLLYLSDQGGNITIESIPEETTMLRVGFNFLANATVEDKCGIEWAKLEPGEKPTPFVRPNPATELLKCQRYYQTVGVGYTIYVRDIGQNFVLHGMFPVEMRTTPTVTILNTKPEISSIYNELTTNRDISIVGSYITSKGIAFLWFNHDSIDNVSSNPITERISLNGFLDQVFGLSADL